MKTLKALILAMSIMIPTLPVCSKDASGGQPDQGSDIPIILHKSKDTPKQHLPSKGIEILVSVRGGMLSLSLPFDEYPVEVKIEGIGETCGIWSSILSNAEDEILFDGGYGEYGLTLTTACNSKYVGYFSIN